MPALKEMRSAVVLLPPARCIQMLELLGTTLAERFELQPSLERTARLKLQPTLRASNESTAQTISCRAICGRDGHGQGLMLEGQCLHGHCKPQGFGLKKNFEF